MASSSSNVVGVHYRVGKKIGEGSFGVIFEGTNLLNNQQVAIKFVSWDPYIVSALRTTEIDVLAFRNRGRATHHNCAMSTAHTRYLSAAVSQSSCPTFRNRLLTRASQPAFLMFIISDKRASTISWLSIS